MPYNGWTIQEIVNDPEWQQLRESLVGTWKALPVSNVRQLRAYLAVDLTDPFRWYRVRNYLVGSAFRMRIISHPDIDRLLQDVNERLTKLELPRKEA